MTDLELQYNEMKDTQYADDYDLNIDTYEVIQQYCKSDLE